MIKIVKVVLSHFAPDSFFRASSWVFLLVCSTVVLSGCRPALYNIAPVRNDAPIDGNASAVVGTIDVASQAILSDEEAFRRFEANLVLAGILAIDVRAVNRGNQPAEAQFDLLEASGRRYSPLKADKALKKIMKFEGVRVYQVEGRKKTLGDLSALCLPQKLSLQAGEARRGVLFFDLRSDIATHNDFVLRVRSGGKESSLKLN